MNNRDRLKEIVAERALLKGDFQLSSGGQSSFYFNCKKVTLHPEGVALLGKILLEEIGRLEDIAAVGGPSIGADPVVGHVAGLSHAAGNPLSAFIVRKRPKEHGTSLTIENPPSKGSRVVIFEDVVTTGKSTLAAIRTAEADGLQVVVIFSLVDREEGGSAALAGYDYRPLFRRSDFSA